MDFHSAPSNVLVQWFRNFDSKDLGLQDLGMWFRRMQSSFLESLTWPSKARTPRCCSEKQLLTAASKCVSSKCVPVLLRGPPGGSEEEEEDVSVPVRANSEAQSLALEAALCSTNMPMYHAVLSLKHPGSQTAKSEEPQEAWQLAR